MTKLALLSEEDTPCPDCERTHPWRDHSDPAIEQGHPAEYGIGSDHTQLVGVSCDYAPSESDQPCDLNVGHNGAHHPQAHPRGRALVWGWALRWSIRLRLPRRVREWAAGRLWDAS